jgi:cobalt-precorrin 5A hydrolase / precorrin-3B C17-methyltransferase
MTPDRAATWLGLPLEDGSGAVARAVRTGSVLELVPDTPWPLPLLPPADDPARPGGAGRGPAAGASGEPAVRVRLSDRLAVPEPGEALLRPPSLLVGVGAGRGVPADEVLGLVREALAGAGLAEASVAGLATADAKAAEPGIVAAATALGVPVFGRSAERLAAVAVPHPSAAALAALGTASVAEAAALAGGGRLLVPKRRSRPWGRAARATCAVVRRPPRGRLTVLAGPEPAALPPVPGAEAGAAALWVRSELRRASVVIAPTPYGPPAPGLPWAPGLPRAAGGAGGRPVVLRPEPGKDAVRAAVAAARAGHRVVLFGERGPGDGGFGADGCDPVEAPRPGDAVELRRKPGRFVLHGARWAPDPGPVAGDRGPSGVSYRDPVGFDLIGLDG